MDLLGKLRNENGQAMVLSVLSMTILLGFVGFAADIGLMFHAKRNMQIAADSAAVAGASELAYGGWNAAGQAAATQNGFTNGANSTVVTINNPPLYGAYAGKAAYVEAIVTQTQPTFFARMFNLNSMNVATRAVAYNGAISNGCVYVLNKTASDAMDLQGSFDVSAPKCGIIVDSKNANALHFTGGGGTLTAGSVGVAGGDSGQTGDSNPAPVTGIVPVSDPLGSLPIPNPAKMTCTTPAGGTLTGTITAGCYSAPAGGTLTLSNVLLGTGTYVLTGNVNLSGSVKTDTGGATLDIATGTLTESTNTVLNIVAPTSGTYNGIAIMEPPPNTNLMLFDLGSSSGLIKGIIYAPDAELELHDSGGDKNGGLQLITDLIVNTLYDQTATLTITSYSQTVPGAPLTSVALVE